MPFRDNITYLEDILASIEAIYSFVQGMDQKSYREDLRTRSAVERQLQIITEAGFRLGNDAQRLCPEVDWSNLRGMGNRLRHAYDLTDDQKVWEVIQQDLPPLNISAANALALLKASQPPDPA